MKGLLILCFLGLSGCQTMLDVLNAIPPLTPEDTCTLQGGKWHSVTRYDGDGNVTEQAGECVSQ
jgi:hypothetical protein